MAELPPQLRALGWAGWLAPLPRELRLAKIEGDGLRGLIILADQQRQRLELSWATVYRRRFDAANILQRRLLSAVDKQDRAAAAREIKTVNHAHFSPLLHLHDTRRGVQRWAGYAPATQRVMQLAWHVGGDRHDVEVLNQTVPALRDQPLDQPQQWSFFGLSFLTPPGLVYQAATLNLGDMTVRVGRPRAGEYSGPSVVVRQLYPANLALARQPMERWMQDLCKPVEQVYRGPRSARRLRDPHFQSVPTSRGPALHVLLKLRWLVRPLLLRAPRRRGLWLLHDQAADRLVGLQIAGDEANFASQLNLLIDELHWAGGGGGA